MLASLNHPNIATLFGLEHLDGQHVLAMELVEGEDLAQRLARGPMPLEEAVPIARQIAEALETAHAKGIVHRDLKPANVMVRPDGTVKVLDFGLARAWESETPAADLAQSPTVTNQYTRAGQVLGTAAYMSPEQARGAPVDGRADIWAFGAVLFEMLSGRRPFAGPTLPDVFANVLGAEPPWGALPPALPATLSTLVRRCLARDLRRRLQSIAEARIALEDVASGGPPAMAPPARPEPRIRSREVAAWAMAAAALLGLGAVLVLGVPRRSGPSPTTARRFAISPPAFGGFENGIALSRDGTQLAFVAPGTDGEDVLWLRPLSAIAPRALAGTEGASYPFWSPDGRWLAFFAKGRLRTIEPGGGTVQSLCAAPNPRGGAWSRAGVLLLSINAGGSLVTVPAGGGEPTPVIDQKSESEAGVLRFPSFLPDGRHFVFYRLGGAPKMGIWLGSIDSKTASFLAAGDSAAVYSPPGFLVFRGGDRLLAQPIDLAGPRLTGPAVPIAAGVWSDSTATYLSAFSISDNGVLAYRTGGPVRSRLLWFDRAGTPLGALGPPGAFLEPAISPDANRVAVTRGAEDSVSSSIWLLDVERGGLTPLSFPPELTATPLWSPDGRQIVYSRFPTGEVFRKDASGAGKEELIRKMETFSPLDDWSRDGRSLLFEILDLRTFTSDIGRVALNGDRRTEPILAAAFSELGARLSADARFLAYQTDESGVAEVFVRSYPDLAERWQISTGGGSQPRWRGDGRELYFVAPDRKLMAVEITTEPRFAAARPHALFQTNILPLVEARNHYDVTPDGRRFLVNSRLPEDATAPIVVVLDWPSEITKP